MALTHASLRVAAMPLHHAPAGADKPANLSRAALSRLFRFADYPNTTIRGHGLEASVFLPDAQRGYYRSSRYDWGSMVGHIVLQVPNGGGNVTLCTSVRPRPHRPLGTDHGIGLAAEFGCGVRGALCYAAGKGAATNGVLGYGDAGKGGEFLKLGVGKLARPLKPRADGFAYNFTWPYALSEPPSWELERLDDGSGVILTQEVRHKRWGWKIRRKIYSCGRPEKKPTLCVDLTLTNTGEMSLRTPYTSGNAFNMLRGPATGPGFAVAFFVPDSKRYHDHAKAASPLSVPLSQIADLALTSGARGMSRITVNKRLLENEVASVNFDVTNTTPPWDGRFHMQLPAAPGWNVLVRHTMWRDAAAKRSGWFGFNLRISRRSVAPRPFLLFDLEPEQSVSVSHRYEFDWRPQL